METSLHEFVHSQVVHNTKTRAEDGYRLLIEATLRAIPEFVFSLSTIVVDGRTGGREDAAGGITDRASRQAHRHVGWRRAQRRRHQLPRVRHLPIRGRAGLRRYGASSSRRPTIAQTSN
ncbi:hypothetical protein F5Y11DRAFT_193658 [Daldinia sp. FL1419]|nr:hypothetical protein F5Y11DRAFT_193658 [Daldinia sp. FL1419]